MSDLWVFGYGSLIWRPGFKYIESVQARLFGFHRALCIYSWFHRGTPQVPGLVLGLDNGGSCRGMAFRVSSKDKASVIDYLREREQVTMVYREVNIPIFLEKSNPNKVEALCYLINREHDQYAGKLSKESQLELIRNGVGESGPNPDYVINTVDHLNGLGIIDQNLCWLANQLKKSRN